jgi:hypothetical protein
MEHLSDEQRKAISKLTLVKLAAKLTQIGVSEGELETMNKEAMMQAWALAVHEGRDKPVAAAVAETEPEVAKVGSGSDFERMRLEFEMRKWEEEKEERIRREKKEEEERIRRERKEEEEKKEREAERIRREKKEEEERLRLEQKEEGDRKEREEQRKRIYRWRQRRQKRKRSDWNRRYIRRSYLARLCGAQWRACRTMHWKFYHGCAVLRGCLPISMLMTV